MTPAVEQLVAAGIRHEVVEYEHDPGADGYGIEAARQLGVDPSRVFKTLLARLSDDRHVVAVVPVDRRLSLKAIARAAGTKKAWMADADDAERLTGYVVGGISPFGQRTRLGTFVDESALGFDVINVSGGRRGLEITLAPGELVVLLDATVIDLVA